MHINKLVFIAIVALTLVPNFASAQLSQSQARMELGKKAAGFTAGLLSGYAFHELGHFVVGRAEGLHMKWSMSGASTYNNGTDLQSRNYSVAGFEMQILSTEVILRSKNIPKNNSYVLGWLTYNLLNAINYPLRQELSKHGYGDLQNYKKHGGNVRLLEVGLIAHAIWSFYRLKNNTETNFFIQATTREIGVGYGWKF